MQYVNAQARRNMLNKCSTRCKGKIVRVNSVKLHRVNHGDLTIFEIELRNSVCMYSGTRRIPNSVRSLPRS